MNVRDHFLSAVTGVGLGAILSTVGVSIFSDVNVLMPAIAGFGAGAAIIAMALCEANYKCLTGGIGAFTGIALTFASIASENHQEADNFDIYDNKIRTECAASSNSDACEVGSVFGLLLRQAILEDRTESSPSLSFEPH